MLRAILFTITLLMLGLSFELVNAQDKLPVSARGIYLGGTKDISSEDNVNKQNSASVSKAVALKYSVLALDRQTPAGYQYQPNLANYLLAANGKRYGITDPQQNFRNGDSIKLVFEVSQPGYIYITHKGSDNSGETILIPSSNNTGYLTPGQPLVLGPFKIDPPSGVEKLKVIFSIEPISLENNNARLLTMEPKTDTNKPAQVIRETETFGSNKDNIALYFAIPNSQSNDLRIEIDIKH